MNAKLKSRFLTVTSTLLLVLLAGTPGQADDTDIFYGPAVALPPGSEPIVMFSLDWRPNLGSPACGSGECADLIADGFLPAVGPYTFFRRAPRGPEKSPGSARGSPRSA